MRIQVRRDTTENWEKENPVLLDGEIGYDLTTHTLKVGNGQTPWNGDKGVESNPNS